MTLSRSRAVGDLVSLEVPQYLHVLTGHYSVRGSGYHTRRLRGTKDWLLIVTLSGGGRFGTDSQLATDSQQLRVQERDCVLIRPDTAHDYGIAQGEGSWELLWSHFHPRPHWYDWLAWPEHAPGLMHLTLDSDLLWKKARACFRQTHLAAIGTEPHTQDLAMNSLENLLLCCHGALLQRQSVMDERIRHILHWLNGRLAEPLDIASLAAEVALSPSRFAHLFRGQVGASPMQYLNQLRIQRAKQLLERTTNSITQVAYEVGLDTIYFSLRFKQHTGLSPRAYRAQKMSLWS